MIKRTGQAVVQEQLWTSDTVGTLGEDASRLPGNVIEAATVQVIDKRSPSY